MAIHYDFYPNSGIADEGQWHVRALESETVEAPTLFERIEQRSTLTQADMKGALSALVAGIAEALKDGNRVHLEGLGHFSVSIKGKVVTTEDGALRLDKAGVRSILFRPDRYSCNVCLRPISSATANRAAIPRPSPTKSYWPPSANWKRAGRPLPAKR